MQNNMLKHPSNLNLRGAIGVHYLKATKEFGLPQENIGLLATNVWSITRTRAHLNLGAPRFGIRSTPKNTQGIDHGTVPAFGMALVLLLNW